MVLVALSGRELLLSKKEVAKCRFAGMAATIQLLRQNLVETVTHK